MTLFDSLVLANGAVIPNRLCKPAMEENMPGGVILENDEHLDRFGVYFSALARGVTCPLLAYEV